MHFISNFLRILKSNVFFLTYNSKLALGSGPGIKVIHRKFKYNICFEVCNPFCRLLIALESKQNEQSRPDIELTMTSRGGAGVEAGRGSPEEGVGQGKIFFLLFPDMISFV